MSPVQLPAQNTLQKLKRRAQKSLAIEHPLAWIFMK
jgi:hypothetical protein